MHVAVATPFFCSSQDHRLLAHRGDAWLLTAIGERIAGCEVSSFGVAPRNIRFPPRDMPSGLVVNKKRKARNYFVDMGLGEGGDAVFLDYGVCRSLGRCGSGLHRNSHFCPASRVISSVPVRTLTPLEEEVDHPPTVVEEVLFGPFSICGHPPRVHYLGEQIAFEEDALMIFASLMANHGLPVPEAEIVVRLADKGPLWPRIARINTILASCSSSAGFVAHHPERGFALIVPPSNAHQVSPALSSTALIGRDAALARISHQLREHGFVTILGPGGIGKTTVARALWERMADLYPDGCCFLDLAPLSEADLLPVALASALGIRVAADKVFGALGEFLRDRRMLVVLDSCEHVIGTAAAAAEALRDASPGVHVLATSREPLLATGEWQYRLAPMECPTDEALTVEEAMGYPAFRLFVERARADAGPQGLELGDEEIRLVCILCRQLDGIPLALELAAARVHSLGLAQLVVTIGARMLLNDDARPGLSGRHATLAATLDWSYELLCPSEQSILRRLSVFRGDFTLDAAARVTSNGDLSKIAATECVLNLMSKSLVALTGDQAGGCLRLLDTTRAYALAKLTAGGELRELGRRHAQFLCEMLKAADSAWEQSTRQDWLRRYVGWLDDIRVALDWAFDTDGDPALGAAIVAYSCTLGHMAGFGSEFSARAEQAAIVLAGLPEQNDMLLFRLIIFPCFAQVHQRSAAGLTHRWENLDAAMQLTRQPGMRRFAAAPLTGWWARAFVEGDYRNALVQSKRIARVGRQCADPAATLVGQRTMAQGLHYMGHHVQARAMAESALGNSSQRIPLAYNPLPIEVGTAMRILLTRILWLQGFPEQASRMAAASLELARADSPSATSQVLALAALPLAWWCGDRQSCSELGAMLSDETRRRSFSYWSDWADAYRRLLDGDPASGTVSDSKQCDHMLTFDSRFFQAHSLLRVERGMVGWCAPETLRVHGECLLAQGRLDEAEARFRRSLALAAEHGALAWELRSASSLARVLLLQHRADEEQGILHAVLARYSEGYECTDLLQARALLAKLDTPAKPAEY